MAIDSKKLSVLPFCSVASDGVANALRGRDSNSGGKIPSFGQGEENEVGAAIGLTLLANPNEVPISLQSTRFGQGLLRRHVRLSELAFRQIKR